MKDVISIKAAGSVMLVLFSALIVFHVLVIFGIIPPVVWGGYAAETDTVVTAELVSILLTAAFMVIAAMQAGFLWPGRFRRASVIGTWCMFSIMFLSTIGNLISTIAVERLMFTPVAALLTVLAFRLGIERRQ